LGAIFISYRRTDSAGESGRLSDDLIARFGVRRIFMDVDAIQLGRDFRKAIQENVGACSVFLCVIGPDWLDARSAAGTRRLDHENDYVRLEIATALGRDVPVVPVLVRGAQMPKADDLPEDIRDLAYRNCVELTHVHWKSDVHVLIDALHPYIEGDADHSAPAAVIVVKPDAAAETPAPHVPVAAQPEAPRGAVAAIDGALLDQVRRELAFYIGPIAELVVNRAAKRCSTLPDLYKLVAEEIDGSADRARFLASCPE
jgi:TIR domain-containing protein